MHPNSNKKLWKLAKQVAAFQRNLFFYFLVNLFLWIIWWFTTDNRTLVGHTPWPSWVMLVWGISLLFQFIEAYINSRETLTENNEKNKKKKETIKDE